MTQRGLASQPKRPQASSSLQNFKRLKENNMCCLIVKSMKKNGKLRMPADRDLIDYTTEGNQRKAMLQL
jgi:tRNA A37 threonylcarbamoyladenosine synthetase subunit TsaC/SUA5/YrdC